MGKQAVSQAQSGRATDEALRERYVRILERTPSFQALPRRQRHRIAKLAAIRSYHNDDVIVREGDDGDSFYVILEGDALAAPAAGHDVLLWSQDCFGELSLIDGAARSATVTAAGPVTAAVIARKDFLKLLHDEPAVAVGLLPGLALVARDLVRMDMERIPDHAQTGDRQSSDGGDPGRPAVPLLESRDVRGRLLLLEHIGIFAGLKERHRRRLARLFTVERFSAGEAVVVAGARGDSLHVILDGLARVRRPGGHTRTLSVGDGFGELALIDGAPRAATVYAEGELTTARLARTEFTKLLKAEPAIAVGLLIGLVRTIRDLQKAAGVVV